MGAGGGRGQKEEGTPGPCRGQRQSGRGKNGSCPNATGSCPNTSMHARRSRTGRERERGLVEQAQGKRGRCRDCRGQWPERRRGTGKEGGRSQETQEGSMVGKGLVEIIQGYSRHGRQGNTDGGGGGGQEVEAEGAGHRWPIGGCPREANMGRRSNGSKSNKCSKKNKPGSRPNVGD